MLGSAGDQPQRSSPAEAWLTKLGARLHAGWALREKSGMKGEPVVSLKIKWGLSRQLTTARVKTLGFNT